MKHTSKLKIRKIHRFLGVVLGVQFLLWTISGLYFSWSDLDQIHGDYFMKEKPARLFTGLVGIDSLTGQGIKSVALIDIAGDPHYWINDSILIHAHTGASMVNGISASQAVDVANEYLRGNLPVLKVEQLSEVGAHHEYRGRKLPVYAINYDHPHDIIAYVSKADGRFQRIRHRNWRWFDFLWMTHTMDYQSRDNFNTLLLRIFSLFGLITVLSGFVLFFTSRKKRTN